MDDQRVWQLLEEAIDSGLEPEEVCRAAGAPELVSVVLQHWQRLHQLQSRLSALFPPPGAAAGAAQAAAELPRLPGYEVQGVLGRGGMGVVYRARHLRLERVVAVKMLLAGASATTQERERFLSEARAVAGLHHPNIVQLHEVGELDGRPYFTMEHVEGGSLAQKLVGSPQPARQAAALVATLAGAVQAAHQGGIVHRDLKPGNVLLDADGTPRITDFGLARRLEGGAGLTLSGDAVGTPSYMAPEQAQGQTHAVGPAVDVYALGAILYECLTGRPPFRGETAAATLHQVVTQDPVPPSRLNGKVPRDLETICLKCLHKAPAHRYGSARALADDLQRFGEGRPIQARPVGWGARCWRWVRRNPMTAALLTALLGLVLLTVGGGLWWERQQAYRRGRAQTAIEAALKQMSDLRRQGRWSQAQALLAQTTSLLDDADSDDLRQRLAQTAEDLKLAATLEQIWFTPALDNNRLLDFQAPTETYAQAFTHAGLNIHADEDGVVARIQASAVRPQLVTALDHWAVLINQPQVKARLLRLARRVDPDPKWGDRIRDPALWGDRVRLEQLAAEVQQGLAGEAVDNEPSPALVLVLAMVLANRGAETEPLLRAAQRQRPEDFWLNYALGSKLRERKPADAVGFYRAALVTRPTAVAVYLELCQGFIRLGQRDDATWAARKAVELYPGLSVAHHQLGICLEISGRRDQAMAEYARAIQLDPKAAISHYQLGVCEGRTRAAHRQWAPAAKAYALAIQHGRTEDGDLWFEYAASLLLSGDRAGYVRARAHMIEACGKPGGPRTYHVARACTLAPDAIPGPALPGRLAEKELQAFPRAFWSLTEQGALHYRAGRFPQAAALFEQSLLADPMPGRAVLNWLWLALAQQRQGKLEVARRWLGKAIAWLDKYSDGMPARANEELGLHLHNWLEAHVLRREAEALVRRAEKR